MGGGLAAPSMGRITGSASIETLVRVGIEKENGLVRNILFFFMVDSFAKSQVAIFFNAAAQGPEAKMVVLHDFTPCVDDELEVKRGQVRERERAKKRE